MQAGVDLITGLVNGIIEAIPTLTESAVEIVTALLNGIVALITDHSRGAQYRLL